MVKSRTATPVLTCDICSFKVSNPYIFKRHLHKCYTIHGIASKRSTSRHPIRLKGTEGLRSSDCSESEPKATFGNGEGGGDQQCNEALFYEKQAKEEANQSAQIPGSFRDEEEGSIGSVSSQWGVTNSPQVPIDALMDKKEDGAGVAIKVETPSPTSQLRAKFERKYTCETCPFETLKSRNYLYHLRDEHGEKLNIFECHLCDYASRYNNKLGRHMAVHKKPGAGALAFDPSIISHQRLRVKPLKLKRLSVKTSLEFEISSAASRNLMSKDSPPMMTKVSPSPLSKLSPSSTKSKVSTTLKRRISPVVTIKGESDGQTLKPKQREVFKKILTEDGSHRYQCRSCLFYTNTSHNVKKHHVLCHSKELHCSYCNFVTTEQAEYYEHLLTHGGTGKLSFLKCEDCSYVTNARSNYEKHRSFHGANSPHHCTVCNFAAESESKVKRHMATQHTNQSLAGQDGDDQCEEESMECQKVDGVKFLEVDELDLDEVPNMPFAPHERGEDIPDSYLLKYRCPQCPTVCLRKGNFTRHLIARHNFTQASASLTSKNLQRKMMRKRKLTKSLPAPISVKMRRQLANVVGENLKCPECSYTAKWPSDLRRHRQVHTIVKRFKCTMCNNKYKYLGDLNVHMRRDHLTEPQDITARNFISSEVVKKASPALFRCPICPFSTHSKSDLEKHSKQHKDIEKTFRCRLCDYQTYWRGDVGRHLFRHHSILLGKDPHEVETYFIHRPEIRPLTKQPHHNNPMLLSPIKKTESEDGMEIESDDFSKEQNPDDSESPVGSAYKNAALISGKEGQFACTYPGCDHRTTTSERLESHWAYHENLKQFMCPTCGKRTNWKWDIVKHLNKVHRDTYATTDHVVTLSIEEARATIGEYLSQCERKTGSISVYFCSQCDFKSGDKSSVISHLSINHKDEEGKVLCRSMSKSHSNSDLSTTSGDNSLDSEQLLSVSDTANRTLFVEPTPKELSKMDKPYACAICKKAEISKAEVKKHYNYAHPYKDIRVIYTVDGTEFDYNTNIVYQNAEPILKTVRPDSKYSNPKMHGYVKPFKCSICGLRSNWKWDLKKHLRAKHPNHGGFVIMLSIAEAKSTYALECSPSHPKEVNRQPTYKVKTEKPSEEALFKHPDNIKGEFYDANYGIFGSLKLSPKERVTNFDPNRRQWKCSGCSYISNWRRNMARHVQRHHPLDKNKIRVIPLHLLSQDTQERFQREQHELSSMKDYLYKGNEEENFPYSREKDRATDGVSNIWHCSKCSFRSSLKTHIIVHMQKHGMKPFLCGVCNKHFMNRGPLHRHIQKSHRRLDYVKLCKVNLDFGDDNDTLEDVFVCCLCQMESKDKSSVISHIDEEHGYKDYEYHIVTMQKKRSEIHTMPSSSSYAPQTSSSYTPQTSSLASPEKPGRKRKHHFCQLCPFRSQKKSMLAFHITYHKPSPINRFKCKYCPYYVSTTRLLHQHQRKWHLESRLIESGMRGPGWEQAQATPPASPLKYRGGTEHITTSTRRHFCEKCPYTTNSKNDFIYHKQFHRPKRTAEFKCEYCDYWVVHKRLLKQHMRLHTKEASRNVEVSPAKSIYSDPGLVYDPVGLTELAALKQQMISAKITPSLSKSPKFSPMKMATKLAVDDKPGYVLKNGLYRKLHKCHHCPYTNTRARNMQLHEMMHGPRQCSYPLMKCPYCDYYVGSKGLLSHHMKVHLKNYGDTPENDAAMASFGMTDDDDGSDTEIQTQHKVDTLLSISRFKRYGCEKCPYASAKRQHFERHLELHGSRQRYTCQYCDYSVPSSFLLTQHSKLHLMPNQNLLASQSITNLHEYMSEVPADVALASALPPTDRDMPVTISVIHDHLGLYENSIYDAEPKKLYRCDRCPYANVRRDYLLSHLKFHMVPSSLVCPYCDYSAPKQALLIQHIRVHFCPLPELSDWLRENGQTERETNQSNQRNIDLAEALKVAHEYQNQSKKRSKGVKPEAPSNTGKDENTEEKENMEEGQAVVSQQTLICQYCDREFASSEKLVKHELQHLIGNQFEMALKTVSEDQQQNVSKKKVSKFASPIGVAGTKGSATKKAEMMDIFSAKEDNIETTDIMDTKDALEDNTESAYVTDAKEDNTNIADVTDTKEDNTNIADVTDAKEDNANVADVTDAKEDNINIADVTGAKEDHTNIADVTDAKEDNTNIADVTDTKEDNTNIADVTDAKEDNANVADVTDAKEDNINIADVTGAKEDHTNIADVTDAKEDNTNIANVTDAKEDNTNIADVTDAKEVHINIADVTDAKEDNTNIADVRDTKEDNINIANVTDAKEDNINIANVTDAKEGNTNIADVTDAKEDNINIANVTDAKEDNINIANVTDAKEDNINIANVTDAKEDNINIANVTDAKEDNINIANVTDAKEDNTNIAGVTDAKEESSNSADVTDAKEDNADIAGITDAKEDVTDSVDVIDTKEDSTNIADVKDEQDSTDIADVTDAKELNIGTVSPEGDSLHKLELTADDSFKLELSIDLDETGESDESSKAYFLEETVINDVETRGEETMERVPANGKMMHIRKGSDGQNDMSGLDDLMKDANGDAVNKDVVNEDANGDAVNENVKDDSVNKDTNGDAVKKYVNGDSVNKNIKDDSVNKDANGDSANEDVKDDSVNADVKMDSVNEDANGDSVNEDVKDDLVNADVKSDSVNEDVKDDLVNADVKMDSVNEDANGDSVNEDVKDDLVNADVKSDSVNEDVKDDLVNADVKSDSVNEDVKDDLVNADVKSDSVNEDVKSDSVNEDVKGDAGNKHRNGDDKDAKDVAGDDNVKDDAGNQDAKGDAGNKEKNCDCGDIKMESVTAKIELEKQCEETYCTSDGSAVENLLSTKLDATDIEKDMNKGKSGIGKLKEAKLEERSSDAREEIADVLGEIQKLLEDVEMPEVDGDDDHKESSADSVTSPS